MLFSISNFRRILNDVCSLLGNSLESEFYVPTFRNTLSVPSSQAGKCRMIRFEKCWGVYTGKCLARAKHLPVYRPQHFSNLIILHLPAYEDGTERVFRNVAYKIQTPGNYPEERIVFLTEHIPCAYFQKEYPNTALCSNLL